MSESVADVDVADEPDRPWVSHGPDRPHRYAVVLSGSIGLGHAMMAQALIDELEPAGWGLRTLDCMSDLGPVAGRVSEWAFHRLISLPGLYDALHFAHLRAGSRVAATLDRLASSQLTSRLAPEFADSRAEIVFSVFATGAAVAARLKRFVPRLRAVVLCTDVTVHRLWVHEGTDLFLVTSEAAAASVYRHRPRATVAVVPPPVRQSFFRAPPQEAARAALGIPDDAPCALLIDSGWGLAPLPAIARALNDSGVRVLAVAGRNRMMAAQLRRDATVRPLLHAFGFTEHVPALMSAADVVVALPGATTCNEARVVGRPLVLLDGMPGHGRDNLQHQLALGDAWVGDLEPSAACDVVRTALDHRLERKGPAATSGHAQQFGQALAAALARIDVAVDAPTAASAEGQFSAAATR